MDVLLLFSSKGHFVEFCSIEKMDNQFIHEAIDVWDKLEGTLPRYDIFIKAFTSARWEAWGAMHRWN